MDNIINRCPRIDLTCLFLAIFSLLTTQKIPLGAQTEFATQTCKYFLELLLCSLQSEPVPLSLLTLGSCVVGLAEGSPGQLRAWQSLHSSALTRSPETFCKGYDMSIVNKMLIFMQGIGKIIEGGKWPREVGMA